MTFLSCARADILNGLDDVGGAGLRFDAGDVKRRCFGLFFGLQGKNTAVFAANFHVCILRKREEFGEVLPGFRVGEYFHGSISIVGMPQVCATCFMRLSSVSSGMLSLCAHCKK